jgi:hypothetical protein
LNELIVESRILKGRAFGRKLKNILPAYKIGETY